MPTIEKYPLERVKIVKKWIVSMISWIVLIAALLFGLSLAIQLDVFSIMWIPLVLLVILAVWQAWYENEYYNRYFYDFQPKVMVIRKGVITTRETTLPYTKIQDVYMDQDILDRVFNIWDVHVSTPTFTSGVEAHIDGVNRENALVLRDSILKQMHSKKKGGR